MTAGPTPAALIDHVRRANNWNPADFAPFLVDGTIVGRIRRDRIARLRRFADIFVVSQDEVSLAAALDDFAARSAAMGAVLRTLREEGELPGWRDEAYPVKPAWHDRPCMQIERAACPWFGIRAWGVHLNGFVRRGDGLHMWIATRARDRPAYPGELDNMVAGGQPIELDLAVNLVKECGEEAGIPADIARRASAVGMISYRHQGPEGLKPDQQFCYDLELPAAFTPHNGDGEVESFSLLPIDEVMRIVRETYAFKFNCALVVIDFLIRHGLIDGDSERDYAALCCGLRAQDGP